MQSVLSSAHFKIAAKFNPNYYSVFLSWGHALSDLARKTGSAKDYMAAFEKYRRAAEIDPTDTAAHHSWHYALLELAKRSKGSKKEAFIEQAPSARNLFTAEALRLGEVSSVFAFLFLRR